MRGQQKFLAPYVCALWLVVCGGSASGQPAAPEAAWPHAMTVGGANVVVYQPQAIDWPDHKVLTTREAIAITRSGEKTPILGTTEISFSTQTDAVSGNVILTDPELKASHFPALDTQQAERIEQQNGDTGFSCRTSRCPACFAPCSLRRGLRAL